jgi:hypothetical protein
MNATPTDPKLPTPDPELPPADHPRATYGYVLGLLAGLAMAVLYAVAAEVFGVTIGLLALGFVGGFLIGDAVTYGAWSGRAHVQVRGLQIGAALIAGVAWVVAVVLAFVLSQVLLPSAATGLLERVSLSGFAEYLGGTFDTTGLFHLCTLFMWSYVSWRKAR